VAEGDLTAPPTLGFFRRYGVHLLIAALAAASVAIGVVVWDWEVGSQDAVVTWWALAVLFAIAESCVVHVHVDRQAHTFSLSEIPLVLGLAFATPGGLLIGRVVGSFVALAAVRRQPPLKIAFNLAYFTLDVGVAIVITRVILGHQSASGPWWWLAATVATTSSLLLGSVVVSLVIAAAEGRMVRRPFSAVAGIGGVTTLVSTDLGLIAVAALAGRSAAGWLLTVGGIALFGAYRAHARLRSSNERLGEVYGFSRAVTSSLSEGAVPTTILEQTCALLRAGRAELVLVADDGAAGRVIRLDEGEVTVVTGEVAASTLAARLEALHGEASVLVEAGIDDPVGQAPASARRSALVALLGSADAPAGSLSVAGRLGEVDAFDDEDRRLFETLANHATLALRNQGLVQQLQREAAERKREALHDALTGLPNRTQLEIGLRQALASRQANEIVAVLLVDLDRFKDVNDTLGHHYGDELLRHVATRIQKAAGPDADVARLGGDEFAITLSGALDEAAVIAVAERIGARLIEPFQSGGLVFEVGASIGIAVAPYHGEEGPILLQRADVAMYTAKRAGRDVSVYCAEDDNYSPSRLALAAELRRAIEANELLVEYQPKVSMSTGAVVGVEALARWHHPKLGFIPPDQFIEIAERSGSIGALTERVLNLALGQVAQWRAEGFPLTVAVNVSVRNLLDDSLPTMVTTGLAAHGLPPSALTLELTESSIIADPPRTIATLNRLTGLGVSLSIDDYGTGYSSLSYLHRLPVDEIKIDKSFVLNMLRDEGDAVIVRSTIDLGHSLGLQVTAEGIEDERAWQLLAEAGCDLGQGFFLRRPGTGAQVGRWLREREVERQSFARLEDEVTIRSEVVEPPA
jgi:diguanylate cyclase (GGDEF)-like protein